MAAVVVSGHSQLPYNTHHILQAQFILSPDPTFSEKGSISKIEYHDCFTWYKKFIIKHLQTPQMKMLVAWLNMQLFLANAVDNQPASPTQAQDTPEDDEFAEAFNQSVEGALTVIPFFTLLTHPADLVPVVAVDVSAPSTPTEQPSPSPKPSSPAPTPPADPIVAPTPSVNPPTTLTPPAVTSTAPNTEIKGDGGSKQQSGRGTTGSKRGSKQKRGRAA